MPVSRHLFRRVLAAATVAGAFAYLRGVYRFRDPVRLPPATATGAVLSPADGTVCFVRRVDLGRIENYPHSLTELLDAPVLLHDGWLIGVVISPLDVHYTYQPTGGVVVLTHHRAGQHTPLPLPDMLRLATWQPADLLNTPSATENERYSYILHSAQGDITVTQIGLRHPLQVTTYLKEGQPARAGNKATFLPEGGLVLVHLGHEWTPQVQVGQRVRGAETVLAQHTAPSNQPQDPNPKTSSTKTSSTKTSSTSA